MDWHLKFLCAQFMFCMSNMHIESVSTWIQLNIYIWWRERAAVLAALAISEIFMLQAHQYKQLLQSWRYDTKFVTDANLHWKSIPQGDFGPCAIQIINITAFDERNMVSFINYDVFRASGLFIAYFFKQNSPISLSMLEGGIVDLQWFIHLPHATTSRIGSLEQETE
jgi:hypothetical protein